MNQKTSVMTPARLAFYSSVLFWGTSIPVLAATILILLHLVSRDVDIIISALLGFIVSCFTLPWFLRRNATRYQIQIITQQGEQQIFSGSAFVGFMFGFFWRSIVVGVVTGAIAALLRGAYGSDIDPALSVKIDYLESFLCSFLSFWWVYAAPMGKNRIVFGVSNSEVTLALDSDSATATKEKREFSGLKDSASSLKETISGFLGVVAAISYLGIGVVQMVAVIDFFRDYWGWWLIPSLFVSSIVAYMPIIGAVAGIMAATKIWGWSLLASVALFCFPLVIMVLIVMVAGISVAASALFGQRGKVYR